MYHFFVESGWINPPFIDIEGSDVNHIMNVLRFEVGDELVLCDGLGYDYKCSIDSLTKEVIRCTIQSKELSKSELPLKVSLYQGAPKQDKLETIIQKCVELGVYDIKPVVMQRSIVKFDAKKIHKKVERWQKISASAAKQSKRGIIPKVFSPLSFSEMLSELSGYSRIIVPYENEDGMKRTREVLCSLKGLEHIAVVIGPEGGFSDEEIVKLQDLSAETITLGNRILRTETAGLASMAMISYQVEEV